MSIDIGELAYLQKENTQLKDEVEILQTELTKTKYALDVAVNMLNELSKYGVCGVVKTLAEIKQITETKGE